MRYPIYGVVTALSDVTVYDTDGVTLATIYSAASGGSAIPTSVITASSTGNVVFWVEDTDYPVVYYFTVLADGYTLTGIWSFFSTIAGAVPATPLPASTITQLQICNLALMSIGAAPLVALTDTTVQANVVNAWYEICRDALLRSHPWNFAEKWASLTPIGTTPDEFVTGISIYYGTAAPTSGDYNLGDIYWNTNPTRGGNMGWVCIAAGNPGTWEEFGIINL